MNIDEFTEWIEGLDLQTLTDELKEEIITKVEELYDDAKADGFNDARGNMLDYLDSI